MPRLQRITRPRRRVPAGDLDTLIFIESRERRAALDGEVDAKLEFWPDDDCPEIWLACARSLAAPVFDGVSTDRRVTHEIVFRHEDGITTENWVRLESGRRLDIVSMDAYDERGEFLMLLCEDTGSIDRRAASR